MIYIYIYTHRERARESHIQKNCMVQLKVKN